MGRSGGVEREQFWAEVIEDQPSSGLSIRAYCERIGVSQPSFYAWRRRIENARSRQAFLPIRVEQQPDRDSGLEIVLAGDRTIRISSSSDLGLLAEVVRVLEGIESHEGVAGC